MLNPGTHISFWSLDDLDLTDALNDAIWHESPLRGAALKARLHLENHGGLQELRGGLPWVPDLVGRCWGEEGSGLVIGSAYAPFINDNRTGNRQPSHRAMNLTDYANAALKPPEEFLRRFFATVVKDDHTYYERIGALLSGLIAPDRVLLTDLCRASFVRPRGLGQVKGGDAAVQYDPDVYGAYVEANEDWTWKRIEQCAGGVIVTLGDIAEQGLLEVFRRHGYNLSIPAAPHVMYTPVRPGARGSITRPTMSAKKRRQAGWWWRAVRGDREYRVAAVVHPSRWNQYDPGFAYSRALIIAARSARGVSDGGAVRA